MGVMGSNGWSVWLAISLCPRARETPVVLLLNTNDQRFPGRLAASCRRRILDPRAAASRHSSYRPVLETRMHYRHISMCSDGCPAVAERLSGWHVERD